MFGNGGCGHDATIRTALQRVWHPSRDARPGTPLCRAGDPEKGLDPEGIGHALTEDVAVQELSQFGTALLEQYPQF